MYSITKTVKKMDFSSFDYIFKKFDEFYELARFLHLPIIGVYKIAIITTDVIAVQEFVKREASYSNLSITIFMEEQALEVVEVRLPESNIESNINYYEIFKQMVNDRELLFDRYVMYKLYRSIEHDSTAMMSALDILVENCGSRLITEDTLTNWFTINDIVYPSNVLDAFLQMDRNRWIMLNKCLTQMDNDVVMGSIVKEIRKRVTQKATYFKSGTAHDRVRFTNTTNLMIAYRVFITERKGINDAYILFKFYQAGISTSDIVEGEDYVAI